MSYRPACKDGRKAADQTVDHPLIPDRDILLKEEEVAQRQGRSVRTLQNQRVQGGGIPFLKLGRAVRYRLSDVIAWEEARRFSSTSEEGQRRG